MTDAAQHSQDESHPDRLDALIDAIVGGGATESQWDEFRALAGQSAEPWRRLAEQQRLMTTLQADYDREVGPALKVELPTRQSIDIGQSGWSIAAWRPLVGWAAALALGLAWAGTVLLPRATPPAGSNATLLAQYMNQPHVVGELPVEIHDVEQTADGEVVTYVRHIVERRSVNLYNLQMDENSNPVLREARSEPVQLASRY